jgi:acyl CoA:acetate/3-ketoacid CoA transferase beta subunit
VYVIIAIGTLVNDSSVVILGIGLGTLVPLLIATYARWILEITNPTRAPQHATLAVSA